MIALFIIMLICLGTMLWGFTLPPAYSTQVSLIGAIVGIVSTAQMVIVVNHLAKPCDNFHQPLADPLCAAFRRDGPLTGRYANGYDPKGYDPIDDWEDLREWEPSPAPPFRRQKPQFDPLEDADEDEPWIAPYWPTRKEHIREPVPIDAKQ